MKNLSSAGLAASSWEELQQQPEREADLALYV